MTHSKERQHLAKHHDTLASKSRKNSTHVIERIIFGENTLSSLSEPKNGENFIRTGGLSHGKHLPLCCLILNSPSAKIGSVFLNPLGILLWIDLPARWAR